MTPTEEQRSDELAQMKREPTCALCLLKRPTKRFAGIDYCVDDFPEGVE